jgi:NAD+ kinase
VKRNLLIVCNPSRKDAVAAAVQLQGSLANTFDIFTISDIEISGIKKVKISDLPEIEVGIVLGGDGTTLRAAEVAHLSQVPLLGVNLGHVGFLSEVEESNIADVISAVLEKSYVIDPRITLKYEVSRDGKIVDSGWALNEVTVEREKTTMVELFLEIDNPYLQMGL